MHYQLTETFLLRAHVRLNSNGFKAQHVGGDYVIHLGRARAFLSALNNLVGDEKILMGIPLADLFHVGRLLAVSENGSELDMYLKEFPTADDRYHHLANAQHACSVLILLSN